MPFIDSFPSSINGYSLGGALKDLVKVYRNYRINEIILTDQYKHYKANMSYYKKYGQNKEKSKVIEKQSEGNQPLETGK
jgi:hypothetical protein